MKLRELAEAVDSASPAVAAFAEELYWMMTVDALRDGVLRPVLTEVAATSGDGREPERSWVLVNGSLRAIGSGALELAELAARAQRLRAVAPIRDRATARSGEVRSGAWVDRVCR